MGQHIENKKDKLWNVIRSTKNAARNMINMMRSEISKKWWLKRMTFYHSARQHWRKFKGKRWCQKRLYYCDRLIGLWDRLGGLNQVLVGQFSIVKESAQQKREVVFRNCRIISKALLLPAFTDNSRPFKAGFTNRLQVFILGCAIK